MRTERLAVLTELSLQPDATGVDAPTAASPGGYPIIIQGGMGVAVSTWRLANAVSRLGHLGVIAGTALAEVFARRLQDGDPGGHMLHALAHFPFPAMAERIRQAYHIPGGKGPGASYQLLPLYDKDSPPAIVELTIVANFAEVFLAREGHDNPVGMNYLEKIQIPHLASIYGAMLAGVGYVLMGAGIPLKIPGVLDRFVNHQPATYPLQVAGTREGDDTTVTFDPRQYMEGDLPPLVRPKFLAIIASNVLAATMIKRANGRVDGFVIEGPTAGGHNAPPRGKTVFNAVGEPIYGERDHVDLKKIRELGLPFWLAGGYGSPEMLRAALDAGATGIQVGTAFAYCEESGLSEPLKQEVLQRISSGDAQVSTDCMASPTNFPFKVARVGGSISDPAVFAARPRICDLGYLREAYRAEDGEIAFRCAAEPPTVYQSKGGNPEDGVGKKCLCNALMATAGYPQVRNGRHVEAPVVTSGDDLPGIKRFFPASGTSYTAAEVIAKLMAGVQDQEQLEPLDERR
jgi:nitronate monooxygenase